MEKKENMRVYQFRNETGEGTITIYEVFPGVTLAYNDFHMSYYDSEYQPDRDMFCIDYCREGRLEYPAGNGTYSYVEVGDIKLDRRISHIERFEMPLSHYHGAMVAVDMKIAEKSIHEEKPYFYKAQVEKTKALKVFLTEHIEENYTQEQLVKKFGIPITAMKKSFKSIYGMPIGNWLIKVKPINKNLIHIVSSGLFTGVFETIVHDMPKEEAKEYMQQLQQFHTAGWEELLGVKFGE